MPEPNDPLNTVSAPQAQSSADATAAGTYRGTTSEFNLSAPMAAGEVGVLGPYRVVKELGKGGMGAVYLAIDTRLDRKLALKVMLPEFAANTDAKERFIREAKAVAKIGHDNVVTIYEADERDGVPYIAMQFLQGYPLDEFLKKKGSPPLAHSVRIGMEAARGLAAAHELGLVHRDIKPANLWLEAPNGRVKVLDFGLAKPIGTDSELTKSGAVVGTPAYMSPEQARGSKVDARTDIFSLGTVMYRLLTGKNPFAGENIMAVLMALGMEEPTPIRELNPNVPEALAAFVMRMLAKKPEARPQTALEVAQGLRAAMTQPAASADVSTSMPVVVQPLPVPQSLEVSGVAESAFANLTDDDEATEAEAAPVAEPPAPRAAKPKSKVPLLAGGLVALVAVIGVAIALGTGSKKPDDTAKNVDPPPVVVPPKDSGKDGKKDGPKPPVAKPTDLPPLPPFEWNPTPLGQSPFDKLDPNEIPAAERFVPLPKELVAVIGTNARKHWGEGVDDIVISPDGKWAATRGQPQQLFVWNLATRALHSVVPPPLPDAEFRGMTFAPDNRTLYVTTSKGMALYPFLADKPAFEPWPGYEGKGGLFGPGTGLLATFSPDGKTLLLGGFDPNGPLQVWDNSVSPPHKVKEVTKSGHLLGFSADRTAALTARPDADGSLRLVLVPLAKDGEPKALFALPPGAASIWNGLQPAVALSPDGKALAVLDKGGWGDAGTLYDLTADLPKETRFRTPDVIEGGVQFLPDGKTLARAHRLLLDVTQSPPAVKFRIPFVHIGGARVAFTPDGKTAVAGDSVGVHFWDMSGAEPKELDPLPPGVAYSASTQDAAPVLASERGLIGVTRSPEGTVRRGQFWDLTGTTPKPWPDATALVGGMPHWPPLVTVTRDGRHAVVNLKDGARVLKLTATSFEEGAKVAGGLARRNFRDGRGVVRTADGSGVLWDIREPFEKARPLPGVLVDGYWNSTAREDGKLLAVCRKNAPNHATPVELWNLAAEKPVLAATLEGKYAQHTRAFSPDGRYLALPTSHGYADGVHVFDLSGKAPVRLPNFETRTKAVAASAFTPDAKRLATVTLSGHVEVFDVATRARVWEAKLPGAAHWIEFAHDGRHLFTHNSNGTVYVLRLPDLTTAKGDADRKAAEWVLGAGGSVKVNGEAREIGKLADLPAEVRSLEWVMLFSRVAKDEGMALLGECKHLKVAALNRSGVTDAGLAHLARCPALEEIGLEGAPVTDAGFGKFKDHPALKSLYLVNTGFGNASLEALKGCPKLERICLGQTLVTDAGLAHLKDYKALNDFYMWAEKVTDAGIARAAECKTLTMFGFGGMPLTDTALEHVAKMDKLVDFNSTQTKATKVGMEKLAKALPKCKIRWDGGVIEPAKK